MLETLLIASAAVHQVPPQIALMEPRAACPKIATHFNNGKPDSKPTNTQLIFDPELLFQNPDRVLERGVRVSGNDLTLHLSYNAATGFITVKVFRDVDNTQTRMDVTITSAQVSGKVIMKYTSLQTITLGRDEASKQASVKVAKGAIPGGGNYCIGLLFTFPNSANSPLNAASPDIPAVKPPIQATGPFGIEGATSAGLPKEHLDSLP